MNKYLLLLFFSIFFLGCTKQIPTQETRKNTLLNLSQDNYKYETIKTNKFDLYSIQKINTQCKNINIYIEGDGLAWITRRKISNNPTPINPIAFKLMNTDQSQCKIYIARPCQYTSNENCSKKYWTNKRFSEEVIKSFDESLKRIKSNYNNSTFTLIGYSGGGAIATLIPIYRDDIKKIITIAGNLNHKKWTSLHKMTPLKGSLNPIDYIKKLENIKQYHLIGKYDKIIPIEIFYSYLEKFESKEHIKYKIFDANHTMNWTVNYENFSEVNPLK